MKIKFKKDISLEVINEIIDGVPIGEIETFNAGETVDVNLILKEEFCSFYEFDDGSVVYIDDDAIEVVE